MQSCSHFPCPGRALLVEDDPEAAYFAAYALEQHGHFKVTRTADPAVALSLAATGQWDLAVTDLDLPVMSGTALIAALRALVPRLPVILVTAYPGDAIPEHAAGRPDEVLVKPFPAPRLLAAAVAACAAGERDSAAG